MLLCWLFQNVGYSSITTPRQSVCHIERCGFEEKVSCKRVSGRTVQLDEIREFSSSGQRKETPEVVPKFPTATDTEAPTCDVETSVELAAEPRRLGKTRANHYGMRTRYCC